jgi:polyferredoxin/copper chaperone CopZ
MKKFKKNWLRHLIQWGALIAIIIFLTKVFGTQNPDPEAYCPFGGLQTLGTYLVSGSMACSMTMTQIMMGVVLAVAVILFSKLFCGYLCPLGWGSEYLDKLRTKIKVKPVVIRNGSLWDRLLRIFKYILLFIIFYYTITNSELFCKNFDPYYAAATGFKGELTMWMAIAALAVFILGNFFIKMFWCKYICPLGGLSNIFKFAITFVVLAGAFAALNYSGLAVSWVYLLAAACLIGYLWEAIYLKAKVFPLLKVNRDTEACNNCGLCPKRCPYGIDVDKVETVKHIDCTLCGECISCCNQNALSFGRKKSFRWVPAILTVLFFGLALYMGSVWELPTIDVKWGDEAKQENLQKTTIEGLRSVKCYGSSMAFKAQLEKIPGVYGVATFVKHHVVEIFYNPEEVTPEKIQEAIYVPAKFKIATPPAEAQQIKVITIYTEKMYDRMDPNYLGLQFRFTEKGYYGIETEYSCPLTVRLYMDMNEPVDEDFIKKTVEMKELQMPVHGGGVNVIKVDYVYSGISDKIDTVTRREFLERQFNAYSRNYKKNIETWGGKNEAIYELVYPDLDKPLITRGLPYLSSHLSQIDGFLGMETVLNENDEYAFRFRYSKDVLNDEEIWKALTSAKWSILDKEGNKSEVDPKFTFTDRGATKEISPVK